MHAMKTGAMFEAAIVIPALLAEEDETTLAALEVYAQKIGLTFQVVDDVLDATADSATLGKTAGKDAANDKPTFVSLMGIAAATEYAQRLTREAISALPTNLNTQRLADLARAMASRSA
jgi:farnesyl diphosphate synthase